MKRLILLILFLLCSLLGIHHAFARGHWAKGREKDSLTNNFLLSVFWHNLLTTGCPPNPYPYYPYDASCNDTRGANDIYAVFNMADSVLYHLSGGTIIVNTPGCPPLPNPYYPYDANCNLTIGNNDIYAIWYVLHLMDSILIVNPPSGLKYKIAPTYMVYAFNNGQIDTMPYKWNKDSSVIEISPISGFKALGLDAWTDKFGYAQFQIDTNGIGAFNMFVIPKILNPTHKAGRITWGGNDSTLAPFPSTSISSVQQWMQEIWKGNMIFRTGVAQWNVMLPSAGKDTFATDAYVRAHSGGGISDSSSSPYFLQFWNASGQLANSNMEYYKENGGLVALGGTPLPLSDAYKFNVKIQAGEYDGYGLYNSLNQLRGDFIVADNSNDAGGLNLWNGSSTHTLTLNGGGSSWTLNNFLFGTSTDDGSGNTVQVTGGAEVATGNLTVTQLHIYASNTAAKAAGLKTGGLYLYILATTDTVVKAVH